MNPLPSTSRVPNLRDYNIPKILGRKTYVPNLSASRAPKVKAEENSEVKKDDASPSTEKRRPFRERKLLQGSETFAPVLNIASSRITIKSRPKITNSTSSSSHSEVVKKEVVDRDQPSHEIPEVPIKPYIGKFASISSAPPQDLPVSVPRPRLSHPDMKKAISLLKDLFDPSGDESPIFILKTPKYLPRVMDNAINALPNSSKHEVKNEVKKCTIHDLPEGQIGTLQIMKSGRLRLVLGECKFWLHRGVRVDFSEELAFVNTNAENKTGEIVNLGNIKDRIIAVPESVTVFANDNPS